MGAAQQAGEVDLVSDAPPSVPPMTPLAPGESILIKHENQLNPIMQEILAIEQASNSPGVGMGMGALKSIDLDDMISRLLDAGYSTKVTKAVCLKNAEITAICTAARELLLSQPADRKSVV